MVEPELIIVTVPELSTVATDVSEELYVMLVSLLSLVAPKENGLSVISFVIEDDTVIVGFGFGAVIVSGYVRCKVGEEDDPVPVTAVNILPFPTTDLQLESVAFVVERVVHVIPSGLVIILLFVPELATARNSPPANVTEIQLPLLTAAVLPVHVMPSGLVITRLDPELATATNNGLPLTIP